ncbi:MAG: 3-hydroxyacyl-CoA dehydrogenase family protein, partial [Geminicoccaceae bacterium]
AGRLGRKTRRGFYDYGPDAVRPSPRIARPAPAPKQIVVQGDLGVAEPLLARLKKAGIEAHRRSGEGVLRAGDLRIALTDGRCATEWSHMLDAPVVLFDLALDFSACTWLALAPSDQSTDADRAKACGLFQAGGIQVAMLDDLPGLLVMRTVCMLANEAAEAVHTGVASAEAIERAMQLGVNYPNGPLAWAEAIGLKRVLEVIDHLTRVYGEDRYRASPLLRRKVQAKGRFHG